MYNIYITLSDIILDKIKYNEHRVKYTLWGRGAFKYYATLRPGGRCVCRFKHYVACVV